MVELILNNLNIKKKSNYSSFLFLNLLNLAAKVALYKPAPTRITS